MNCYKGAHTAYAQALEEKQKQKGVDEKVLKRKRIKKTTGNFFEEAEIITIY